MWPWSFREVCMWFLFGVCLTGKRRWLTLMGKINHFGHSSYSKLVQFKTTSRHTTFTNDEERLLGMSKDRCCFGYSRALSCADGRWQAAFCVPGNQAKQKKLIKTQTRKCVKANTYFSAYNHGCYTPFYSQHPLEYDRFYWHRLWRCSCM